MLQNIIINLKFGLVEEKKLEYNIILDFKPIFLYFIFYTLRAHQPTFFYTNIYKPCFWGSGFDSFWGSGCDTSIGKLDFFIDFKNF